MTVKELKKFLEKEMKKGHGDCNICTISWQALGSEKTSMFTQEISVYYDYSDKTLTITG